MSRKKRLGMEQRDMPTDPHIIFCLDAHEGTTELNSLEGNQPMMEIMIRFNCNFTAKTSSS